MKPSAALMPKSSKKRAKVADDQPFICVVSPMRGRRPSSTSTRALKERTLYSCAFTGNLRAATGSPLPPLKPWVSSRRRAFFSTPRTITFVTEIEMPETPFDAVGFAYE